MRVSGRCRDPCLQHLTAGGVPVTLMTLDKADDYVGSAHAADTSAVYLAVSKSSGSTAGQSDSRDVPV